MTIVEFLGGLVEETNIHFVSDRQGGTKPHSGEAFVDVLEGGEVKKYCATRSSPDGHSKFGLVLREALSCSSGK